VEVVQGTCGMGWLRWLRWLEARIARSSVGGGFGLQKQKPSTAGAVFIPPMQMTVEYVGWAYMMELMWLLMWWVLWNGRSGGGGVLPCQTENRVRCTRYRSGVKVVGVGHLEGLWGEEEAVVVVVVGCQEHKIERQRGF